MSRQKSIFDKIKYKGRWHNVFHKTHIYWILTLSSTSEKKFSVLVDELNLSTDQVREQTLIKENWLEVLKERKTIMPDYQEDSHFI